MAGLFSGSNARKRDAAYLRDTVEDQISELRSDIASLAKALSQRGTDASKDVRAKAHDARSTAEAGFNDILANGEQLLSELRSRYSGTEKQVRETVREHPLATLGAAAAVGLLVASLLRR